MRPALKTLSVLLLLFLSAPSFGQIDPGEILTAEFVASKSAVLPGESLDIAVIVDIHHPWHVYAPVGNDEFTIPISPSIEVDGKGFTLGEWVYPRAEMIAVAGVPEPAAVYGGQLILKNSLTFDDDLNGPIQISGEVYYQACDDAQCLIPAAVQFSSELPVAAMDAERESRHTEIFKSSAPAMETAVEEPTDAETDEISGLVDDYGILLTFFIIFFGGLALNLTPCVYPLIPITISFFGGQESSKGRTFWMALAYVLGIAVTYSILGVVAALGGGLFGTLLTNPFVLVGIAAVLVGLSLSMFGVYEFRLPTSLMTAASQSKAGIFGSFFMGLTLGIVAAPCVGPFVIGLLTYVAAQQSVLLGFGMFFTLAMGLGLPYLFLAMYSSRISSLPRSGTWMIGVRVIFGLVLIAMAIYFIMPLLGDLGHYVMAVFLLGSGIYLIMFDRSGDNNPGFNRIKQAFAIILIMIGTWMGLPEPDVAGEGIAWEHPASESELLALLDTDLPVMIDVYADWCIPCKEMDKFTFPDREVVALSKRFRAIKIDMTRDAGEFERYFQQTWNIKGVPTYIFLRDGQENASLRSTGFENAEDFLTRMNAAL